MPASYTLRGPLRFGSRQQSSRAAYMQEGAGGPAFDPLTLSPVGWWKADVGLLDASDAVITVDATAVKTWQDQSGTGNHVTQAIAINRPSYRTAIQNSLPVVRFDGVNDYLRLVFAETIPTHVYIVFRVIAFASGFAIFDGATENYMVLRQSASNTVSMQASGSTITLVGGPTNVWHVYSLEYNGASSFSQIDSAGRNATPVENGSGGGLTLGAYGSGLFGSNVDIGEVLMFTTIKTGDDDTNLRAYLKDRWNTP